MDHVVSTSTAAFSGTTHALDFFIFHDGLSAWWEADAQTHLAALGFADRQIRNTTANIGTRYEGKIVGDSPEMCRALDSHGFADLKTAIVKYASYTSLYPAGDPRRFNLGTPPELFHSIQRTWAVAPTMRRIIEDVMALPRVLNVIIDAQGCVVQDEEFRDLRHGRRGEGVGSKGRKQRPQELIATLSSGVPDIPEIAEAKEMIRGGLNGRMLL